MTYSVSLVGTGRAELPAYGMADAEHRVERELGALWPGARASVTTVSRPKGPPRIVEDFSVEYRIEGTLAVGAPSEEEARRGAFRRARELLAGSRYHRAEWRAARVSPAA